MGIKKDIIFSLTLLGLMLLSIILFYVGRTLTAFILIFIIIINTGKLINMVEKRSDLNFNELYFQHIIKLIKGFSLSIMLVNMAIFILLLIIILNLNIL